MSRAIATPSTQPSDARRTHLDSRAVALLLLCCLLWGLNQVAAKVAMAEIPPLTQAAVRSIGGALLVAAWARWRGVSTNLLGSTLPAGLLVGTLFAAEFACIFLGLQYTTASRMAVFLYLSPFVVALGMPLVTGTERPDTVQLCGLAAAFGGVAWAFGEGLAHPVAGDRQWWGDALGLAAAVLWGATTLGIRGSRLTTAPPEATLLYQLIVSGALLAVGAWLTGERWPVRLSPLALALMAFQVVVVTAFSYLLWFWLVRHYPATRLAAFTLFTPLFGLLAGVGLLGEPLTLRLLVAAAAVALGIAVVNRGPGALSPRRRQPSPPET
ncbi:DMT family transporter [Ideonella sp. A 288]|uniref:DMT family transporter n=1 Tax=Ideonella sp. A 288 TaxID=1962181 RepID=UPI001F3E730C|nr:DMT family transporter [Ideonella sp. A 288]